MPVPVLLDFPILPLSHWSPVAWGTMPHSPRDNSSTNHSTSLGNLQCTCVGRILCERWRDGQMGNMFSKVALSRCRRSLASQLRLSRATRTGNYQQFCQPAVLRTQRPTRFLFAMRDGLSHEKSRSLPQGSSRSTVRKIPLWSRTLVGPWVRGVCSQRLGTGSFVHHLNQFLSRDGTSPGHPLSEQRTLSPERQRKAPHISDNDYQDRSGCRHRSAGSCGWN